MKPLSTGLALGAFATLLVATAPAARAQSELENSTFTVTEPVEVGKFTLPPGTYVIKVLMLEANRNAIQIADAETSKVMATVLATPHPILVSEMSRTSRFIYYETAAGQRKALRTWFARDTTNGQDIVYPKGRAMELAALAKAPVIAIPDDVKETEYKSATLAVVTPDQQVRPYEEPARPVMVAEARPATQLPATATRVPLYFTLGVLCVGAAIGAGVLSRRSR